jgi:hypothetical protein
MPDAGAQQERPKLGEALVELGEHLRLRMWHWLGWLYYAPLAAGPLVLLVLEPSWSRGALVALSLTVGVSVWLVVALASRQLWIRRCYHEIVSRPHYRFELFDIDPLIPPGVVKQFRNRFSGKTFVRILRVVCAPGTIAPGTLVAFPTLRGPAYLLVRDPPGKAKGIGRFNILHEIGHVAEVPAYAASNWSFALYPTIGLVVWTAILVRADLIGMSMWLGWTAAHLWIRSRWDLRHDPSNVSAEILADWFAVAHATDDVCRAVLRKLHLFLPPERVPYLKSAAIARLSGTLTRPITGSPPASVLLSYLAVVGGFAVLPQRELTPWTWLSLGAALIVLLVGVAIYGGYHIEDIRALDRLIAQRSTSDHAGTQANRILDTVSVTMPAMPSGGDEMGVREIVQAMASIGTGLNTARESFLFREFLKKDRDSQLAIIAGQVSTLSQESFKEYENRFLLYAASVPDMNLRVRALELYAYGKFMASAKLHNGQWCGLLPETADAHLGMLPW